MSSLVSALAARVEYEGALPCGHCGGHHVHTAKELDSEQHPCVCPCCHDAFAECFEAEFPDLVTQQGGRRVITEAAMTEAIRRMEAEITSMEAELGASLAGQRRDVRCCSPAGVLR